MAEGKDEFQIEFYDKIQKLPIEKIKINPFNPRKRFSQSEEDELLASIAEKGILNPIVVYEKDDVYYLLDGQRRYEVAKKLKLNEVPAHVLKREPSELENLSIMFHMHNVRVEWTDFAIAVTIEKIRELIGTSDVDQISKLTSLSQYKVEKYLRLLDFPAQIIKRFMDSEKQEQPDLDADMLIELHPALVKIEKYAPSVIKKYGKEKIVDILITKKKKGIVQKNKEFRLLTSMGIAVKRGNLDKDVFEDRLTDFFDNENVTIDEIYTDTVKTSVQAKSVLKILSGLRKDILNLDLGKLGKSDKKKILVEYKKLKQIINDKF